MILGIDTSAGQCAVALVRPGEAPIRRAERMERGHAEALWPMIDFALAEAKAGYPDLHGIAVCTGPGSFTGIRIGVAAARGLALGLGVPAEGIDRFDALWAPVDLVTAPADSGVAVALAGPRETAFLRLYDSACAQVGEDRQVPVAELEALTPPNALRFGDGWPGAEPTAGLPDPAVLAQMAADATGEDAPAPYYLRGPNAEPSRHRPPPRIG
ncbi:MAG: tRNA (adenosine(37)-N6)-threonylcarbamoyltransferase complex dimerization subunit type 1 TsaB [Pseudomonadota bacterium]